jgi:predicted small metal-binding protein
MGRMFVDCREMPSENNCTVMISADSEAEVVDAAVAHAVASHQHEDTPELREQIRGGVKQEAPAHA